MPLISLYREVSKYQNTKVEPESNIFEVLKKYDKVDEKCKKSVKKKLSKAKSQQVQI